MTTDAAAAAALGHRHLVLVGLMGAGKTTVGTILAERLGRPFSDSDQLIEARTGRNVREIFRDEGEPAFRAHETAALREALASDVPTVIAAAGGVVLAEENRSALRAAGAWVVWLRAEPELLVERVTSAGHRPLLDDDPLGTLHRMADARDALYGAVADVAVAVGGRSVADVADAVVAAVLRAGTAGTGEGRGS